MEMESQKQNKKIKIYAQDYCENIQVCIDKSVIITSGWKARNENGKKKELVFVNQTSNEQICEKDNDEINDFLKKFLISVQEKITSKGTAEENKHLLINYTNNTKEAENQKKFRINDPFLSGEELRVGNIVGIYRDKNFKFYNTFYDVEMQIVPRFDSSGPESEKNFFLLQVMLEAAISGIKFSNNEVFSTVENVFRFVYIYILKKQLLDSWHLGMYKAYQRFEKNDDKVKGSIDIARHIRLNLGLKNGKMAYSYRERTADNDFNHLLLHTYEMLKREFPELVEYAIESDFEMRSIISELRREAPSYRVTSVSTLLDRMVTPIAHPFYQPYEKLRKTCVDILGYLGVSVFGESTEETEVEGILFYVPDLWECFVADILRKAIGENKGKDVLLIEQEKEKIFPKISGKENETIESLRKKIRQKGFKDCRRARNYAYPDYVFRDDKKRAFLVLDAKYKPKWEEENLHEYLQNDFNKCIRDMRVVNAHATGVVYPCKKNDKNSVDIYLVSEENPEDVFYKIGIGIPEMKEKNYEKWKGELNQLDRLEKIKQVIECEFNELGKAREETIMKKSL